MPDQRPQSPLLSRIAHGSLPILVLCLTPTTAAAARLSSPASSATAASANQGKAEAERLLTETERKIALLEARSEIAEQAESRQSNYIALLAIVIGLFGILVTIITLVLAIRLTKQARESAQEAADQAIRAARDEFYQLTKEQRIKLDEHSTHIEAMYGSARDRSNDIELYFDKIKVIAHTVAQLNSQIIDESAIKLTKEQNTLLSQAAEENKHTPEELWSPDQFKSSISELLHVKQNYNEAIRICNKMIEIYHEDKFNSGYAKNRIANIHRINKEFKDAIALFGDVIISLSEIKSVDAGKEVAWAQCHRAICLINLGHDSAAETDLDLALNFAKVQYGNDAPFTLASRHERARAILNQGRAVEAESLYYEILPAARKAYGDQALKTLGSRDELARSILEQGRAQEAESMLRDILNVREAIEGAHSYNTISTKIRLAISLVDQGRAEEASAILNKAIQDSEQHHPRTPIKNFIYCWLALTQLSLNDPHAAQDAIDRISLLNVVGWPRRHAAKVAYVRARIADALRQHSKAESYIAEAVSVYKNMYPSDHPDRQKAEQYMLNRGII